MFLHLPVQFPEVRRHFRRLPVLPLDVLEGDKVVLMFPEFQLIEPPVVGLVLGQEPPNLPNHALNVDIALVFRLGEVFKAVQLLPQKSENLVEGVDAVIVVVVLGIEHEHRPLLGEEIPHMGIHRVLRLPELEFHAQNVDGSGVQAELSHEQGQNHRQHSHRSQPGVEDQERTDEVQIFFQTENPRHFQQIPQGDGTQQDAAQRQAKAAQHRAPPFPPQRLPQPGDSPPKQFPPFPGVCAKAFPTVPRTAAPLCGGPVPRISATPVRPLPGPAPDIPFSSFSLHSIPFL